MTKTTRYLSLLMATCGVAVAATPAQAVNTSFAFSGNCLDCGAGGSPATGVLTLSDYTLGDAIDLSNVVSFTYSSSNFTSFAFDSFTLAAGAITGNGANNVALAGLMDGHSYYFGSFTNGAWTLINLFPADVGLSGSWSVSGSSAVPEPAVWALMVLGFGMAGVAMRRRKVAVVAA